MKIKHLSVVVKHPENAAKILAAMTDGLAQAWNPGNMEGAWMCSWRDENSEHGEFIELLPQGYLLAPSAWGADFIKMKSPPTYTSTHILLEVCVPLAQIQKVADEHELIQFFRKDSGGPLYEVWVEDQFLVEFVSPEIEDYLLPPLESF